MAKLTLSWTDDDGNERMIEADSVRAIAEHLDADERVPGYGEVFDEAGFVRGWVHARDDWRAAR